MKKIWCFDLNPDGSFSAVCYISCHFPFPNPHPNHAIPPIISTPRLPHPYLHIACHLCDRVNPCTLFLENTRKYNIRNHLS